MVFIFTAITFFSTLGGGMLAIHFKDKLHLITEFSAGAVLATAFFDLLPEALKLNDSYLHQSFILFIAGAGFFVYLLLNRLHQFHFLSLKT